MKALKQFILEKSSTGKYVNNITKEGKNKISIEDKLDGKYNDIEVNVKYFSEPKNDKQVIIVDFDGKYIDFFKNGNFPWEILTYFEDGEDPKEIWEENDFGNCPEWFTKETMFKSFDELEKYMK